MRRKDRERDAAFAWAVFDRAPYVTLAMYDGEGGYAVPVSAARVGEKVYFHCACEGKKVDCLSHWPVVTLTAAEVTGPAHFSVNYRSAALRGRAVRVEDPAEKLAAMEAVTQKYCPGDMDGFQKYAAAMLEKTAVYRVDVTEAAGKERGGT